MIQPSLFDDLTGVDEPRPSRPKTSGRGAAPAARMGGAPAVPGAAPRTKPAKPAEAVAGAAAAATVTRDSSTITIRFPAPARILSSNSTNSKWAEIGAKKNLRALMYTVAQQHGLPVGWSRARIEVVLQFPRAGRRDNANFHAFTAKPLVDALGPTRTYTIHRGERKGQVVTEVGWGLLVGDDTDRLGCGDCPHIRFGDPVGVKHPDLPFGQITVTITDLSGGAA